MTPGLDDLVDGDRLADSPVVGGGEGLPIRHTMRYCHPMWSAKVVNLVGGVALVLVTLSGCASANGSGAVSAPAKQSEGAETTKTWPQGATSNTPNCQPASEAVVNAVNSTIVNPLPGGDTVEWVEAHPDPALGKWLLTGELKTLGSEASYFVVWATTADPTRADFDGDLAAVGSSASRVTSSPPLTPAYKGPTDTEDVPASALGCGTSHSS